MPGVLRPSLSSGSVRVSTSSEQVSQVNDRVNPSRGKKKLEEASMTPTYQNGQMGAVIQPAAERAYSTENDTLEVVVDEQV